MSQSEYEDDPDIEEAFENAAKDMWVLAKKGACRELQRAAAETLGCRLRLSASDD